MTQQGSKASKAPAKGKGKGSASPKVKAPKVSGLKGRGTPAKTRSCAATPKVKATPLGKAETLCTGTLFEKGTPYRVAGTEEYRVGTGFCRHCATVMRQEGADPATLTPKVATPAQAAKVKAQEAARAPKVKAKGKAKASK